MRVSFPLPLILILVMVKDIIYLIEIITPDGHGTPTSRSYSR